LEPARRGVYPSAVHLSFNPSGLAENGQIFQKNPSKKRQENDSDPSADLAGCGQILTKSTGILDPIQKQDGTYWLGQSTGNAFFLFGVCCVDQGIARENYDTDDSAYAAWQHNAPAMPRILAQSQLDYPPGTNPGTSKFHRGQGSQRSARQHSVLAGGRVWNRTRLTTNQ
jgi:hypothetical protein